MRPSVPERASYGAELKINPQPSPELEAEDAAEQVQLRPIVDIRRVDDQPLPADPRAQADVASQHELHGGRFMDADAAPAARRIAVAADVAAVADARAFPEEPSAPGPLPGDELRRDVVDAARTPDPVAFGRDESARVDDSGAEAPARRPVVPGTDVVSTAVGSLIPNSENIIPNTEDMISGFFTISRIIFFQSVSLFSPKIESATTARKLYIGTRIALKIAAVVVLFDPYIFCTTATPKIT